MSWTFRGTRPRDLVISGAVLLVLAFFFLRWFERLNLYHPDRTVALLPAAYGLPYEEMRFRASDGTALHGWLIGSAAPADPGGPLGPPGPAPGTAGRGRAPAEPVVLLCHGNAGNVSTRLDRAAAHRAVGLATFLFDYRGYGLSEGRPTEEGMYLDAAAAYDRLRERGVPAERIVAMGESLGGPVALELARRRPVAAVLLEGSLTSSVALGEELFPILPVRWVARYRYDALEKIRSYRGPVLVAHSRDDEIVPFRHGERLHEAAPGPKAFLPLRGGHNDAMFLGGEAYARELKAFLDRHLPPAASRPGGAP